MTDKPLQPHQQRVVEETIQLDEKRVKLLEFTKGEIFSKLAADEQERLIRQLGLMDQYSQVLHERMEHF